ncbi:MAG: hypothetical protein GY790_07385 [Bacteroidetes bacterium]|nr:hypothetical protein [Bacteroidota bacterium]
MKKINPFMFLAMITALFFSMSLIAQETTVTVKVERDGKVVKDTTYSFEDEEQAKHAMKMMQVMSGDDEHMMKVHKTKSEHHGGHSKTMVFISEDGKTTEIKEMSGDSQVWISEGEDDCDHVKVMKCKFEGGEDIHMDHDAHGKHVVVVKSGDGETYNILIEEEYEGEHDGEHVVKKEVKVIVSGDENGEWTVTEKKKKSKKQ